MRILVCNPPAYFEKFPDRHFIQAGSRWSFSFDAPKDNHKFPHYQPYPFSLAYAVSILRESGYDVDAFDGCALDMNEEEWLRRVEKSLPDFLVTEVPTVSFPLVMNLLKKARERYHCRIVVAGPHVTALPHEIPEGFIGLQGEWELKMPFISKHKSFIDYPFPDREFFPNELYSNFEFHRPSAQMLSSRGCPGRCVFCVERHVYGWGPYVRLRHPKTVVDEMQYVQGLGAKQVWFDDMSLTGRRWHVKNLCREILRRNLDLPWTAMCDMNAKEETVRLMAESGCLGVAFGVESINPDVLKLIGKPWVSKEKALEFVKTCQKYGLHTVATFTIGLPGHNKVSILEDIKFATEELNSDSVQFSIATPFPGTPFYKFCEKNGWLVTRDWTRYDGARYSVVDYPHLSHTEIEELFQHAMEKRKEMGLGFRK
ncbi:MAG: B12-binding domain-containing radical SAM protein [Candidatus Freyarchaeota archaeon]